ncbi:MAG: hypothetical protein M2R45_03916 [Verrucomicrobia subdivision 3 bacterium]|nr:hypothetical protein [Limisphaerales bacterium]
MLLGAALFTRRIEKRVDFPASSADANQETTHDRLVDFCHIPFHFKEFLYLD